MGKRRHLISTDELSGRLGDDNLAILDGSWHMPAAGRSGYKEFLETRIAGARFFDIDEIADQTSPLPHMMPGAEAFAEAVGALGISNDSEIVVYDSHGLFSAARVWWSFKIMGHGPVVVLDGGLKKWRAEERPLESGPPPAPQPARYHARFDAAALRDHADIMQLVASGGEQILDARPPGRFSGMEPEPRPELQSGHMPGSFNLHYAKLIEGDGTLKPEAELRALIASSGIDPAKPIVTSCGSGVTAAILTLALAETGVAAAGLYDGSWTGWASNPDSPIETE